MENINQVTVDNRSMWGKWFHFNELEQTPTYRQVLERILAETPADVLDKKILEAGRYGTDGLKIVCRYPYPNYEDPLGQCGFVAWKFIYETANG